MKKEDAEAMAAFLIQPYMADPSQLQRRLEQSNGSAYSSPNQNVMLVSENQGLGISILDAYDQIHGTRYSVDVALHTARSFRPNQNTDDYYKAYWQLNHIIEEAVAPRNGGVPRAPEALKLYFDALANSPVLRAVVNDSNAGDAFSSLLRAAKKLPPENRPNPALVMMIMNHFVSTHEGAAVVSRDYNQFNERMFAQQAARQRGSEAARQRGSEAARQRGKKTKHLNSSLSILACQDFFNASIWNNPYHGDRKVNKVCCEGANKRDRDRTDVE